jgi:hypothetical protein
MPIFYATFGQRFPREPHPTFPRAHHDGWVAFDAPDQTAASDAAFRAFGDDWSMLYADQPDRDFFPLGELDRYRVSREVETRARALHDLTDGASPDGYRAWERCRRSWREGYREEARAMFGPHQGDMPTV